LVTVVRIATELLEMQKFKFQMCGPHVTYVNTLISFTKINCCSVQKEYKNVWIAYSVVCTVTAYRFVSVIAGELK
jgi:hypothetical protein